MSMNNLESQNVNHGPASAGLSFRGEPIAALATAPGAAAIAIIRMSGDGVLELIKPFFPKGQMNRHKARVMGLGQFSDPSTHQMIDELMFVCFHGPHSFTGEDSIELFCHGGPYIVNRILQCLWMHGFRPAQPGEFTKRAYLNGKLDLSAAEGIKQLVEASTHQQWMAARQLATGRFAQKIEELRSVLIEAMAYLAARIDFPDEGDTQDVDLALVRSKVLRVFKSLESLERSYASGRVAAQGLMVAIIGQPNMGKSTLMNTLLGHERAIVTEIAGTTRDYLEEPCRIKGRLIRLIDTAGIRDASDRVEKLGVERSLTIAQEADFVLLLMSPESSSSERAEIGALAQQIGLDKCLKILTKSDLGRPEWACDCLPLSCSKGEGLEALEDALVVRVDGFIGQLDEEPFLSSSRHLAAIQMARQDLEAFFEAETAGHYDELLAFELQNAARALSGILGGVDVEDILDKVFRDFCVGK